MIPFFGGGEGARPYTMPTDYNQEHGANWKNKFYVTYLTSYEKVFLRSC